MAIGLGYGARGPGVRWIVPLGSGVPSMSGIEKIVKVFSIPPLSWTKLKLRHLFKVDIKKMEPFEIEYITTQEYSIIERYYNYPMLILKDLWSLVY